MFLISFPSAWLAPHSAVAVLSSQVTFSSVASPHWSALCFLKKIWINQSIWKEMRKIMYDACVCFCVSTPPGTYTYKFYIYARIYICTYIYTFHINNTKRFMNGKFSPITFLPLRFTKYTAPSNNLCGWRNSSDVTRRCGYTSQ